MAIFRISKCDKCKYKHNVSKPVEEKCPRCGADMRCLPNYYISYQLQGKKYIEAVAPQRREAEAALGKKKAAIREKRFFDMKKKDITWADGKKKLEGTYPGLAVDTVTMYKNSLKRLEEHGLNKYTLNQIEEDIDIVNDYIADRQDEDVTNSTINRELATLKRIAKLCKLYELHAEIDLLPENEARTRFLTEAEQKSLIAACESKEQRLKVLIALNTGLRKKGVFHMQRSDINFDTGIITRTVKGGKKVHIPMTEDLIKEFKSYFAQQDDERKTKGNNVSSMWVFPSPLNPGKPIRIDTHRSFKNICKRAGISNLRFHDLRHTFASWFLRRTGDLVTLKDILGHSDIKLTMRYAHLMDEHKREAMKKFESGQG
ncbi:MAG: site-specific integrase [Nitrospirae bacterium]|nr:site-specific integrase [Nitrospirota bacterium]MCL5238618.1 site-specific integrase [Nitrospirota bacterium]